MLPLDLPEMLVESRVDVGELGVEVHLPRHGVLVHADLCSRELRPDYGTPAQWIKFNFFTSSQFQDLVRLL